MIKISTLSSLIFYILCSFIQPSVGQPEIQITHWHQVIEIISHIDPEYCLAVDEASWKVKISRCNGGVAQNWVWEPSTKQIVSLKGLAQRTKCLDVWGAVARNGATVGVYPCKGINNQKWTFTNEGYIKSNLGGCLDINNGDKTWAIYWRCWGGKNQKFYIRMCILTLLR